MSNLWHPCTLQGDVRVLFLAPFYCLLDHEQPGGELFAGKRCVTTQLWMVLAGLLVAPGVLGQAEPLTVMVLARLHCES
jgi:hypothetical protein